MWPKTESQSDIFQPEVPLAYKPSYMSSGSRDSTGVAELQRLTLGPGGTTFKICVNMCVRKFTEKGAFSEWGSDLSRSEIRVSFLAESENKGVSCREWLWKGWDSSIMNFSDMGPFENLSYTHVNIGFQLSVGGPPPPPPPPPQEIWGRLTR